MHASTDGEWWEAGARPSHRADVCGVPHSAAGLYAGGGAGVACAPLSARLGGGCEAQSLRGFAGPRPDRGWRCGEAHFAQGAGRVPHRLPVGRHHCRGAPQARPPAPCHAPTAEGSTQFAPCPLDCMCRVRQAGPGALREWLLDTRQPDSNSAGEPLRFDTGMAAVPDVSAHVAAGQCPANCTTKFTPSCMQALDMGVRLMLRSEVASFTCAWKYSYQGRKDAPQARAGRATQARPTNVVRAPVRAVHPAAHRA